MIKFEEEEDDLSAPVAAGTQCRYSGCSTEYTSDELHRKEGGAEAECTYHPKPVSWTSLHPIPIPSNLSSAYLPRGKQGAYVVLT